MQPQERPQIFPLRYGMTNKRTSNGKGNGEMRGFFAALRMTTLSFIIIMTAFVHPSS
jgi:hypothetical protein